MHQPPRPNVEVNLKLPQGEIKFHAFNGHPPDVDLKGIFEGVTYPGVPFISDARTVIDVGPGAGASSIYLAINHPGGVVYAFEPRPELYSQLAQNVKTFPNIRIHPFGLFDRDCRLPMATGQSEPETPAPAPPPAPAGSILDTIPASFTSPSAAPASFTSPTRVPSAPAGQPQALEFKSALATLAPAQKIDVLKIDLEGAEVPILRSIQEMIPGIALIYLQYHDDDDRIQIDQLLKDTHLLLHVRQHHPHRGELCYVNLARIPSKTAFDAKRLRLEPPVPVGAPGFMFTATPPADPIVGAATRGVVQTFPAAGRTSNQGTFEVAVIMPSILRPTLVQAVRSVFEQDIQGAGQLLIGIDKAIGDRSCLDQVLAMKPGNWAVSIFDPGYSTSVRHGGVHLARDGGSLRTLMSFAANSRYVAYLDDDNWWAKDHLSSLLSAVVAGQWAFSLRWWVDSSTSQPICVDTWESVGPDQGIFKDRFGGFVDTNTLMFDKLACDDVIRWWCIPLPGDAKGMSCDRHVFNELKNRYRGKGTGKPTAFYRMDPEDGMHPERIRIIEELRRRQST